MCGVLVHAVGLGKSLGCKIIHGGSVRVEAAVEEFLACGGSVRVEGLYVRRTSTCAEAPSGGVRYKVWRAGSGDTTVLG
jgi:hypothetical protein